MAPERQPGDIRLTGLHINLIDRIVTLEAEDGRRAKVSFGQRRTPSFNSPEPHSIDPEFDTPDELTAGDDHSWKS